MAISLTLGNETFSPLAHLSDQELSNALLDYSRFHARARSAQDYDASAKWQERVDVVMAEITRREDLMLEVVDEMIDFAHGTGLQYDDDTNLDDDYQAPLDAYGYVSARSASSSR